MAISSYQGGHVEYFTYLVELLRERGAGHVKVYGGGGGVIVAAGDRAAARARRRADLLARGRPAARPARDDQPDDPGVRRRPRRQRRRPSTGSAPATRPPLARALTLAEAGRLPGGSTSRRGTAVPVLGITGTGGSGKSSLTDELVRRFRLRPGGQAAHRRARRRPDHAAGRGSAARRPDPDERARPASRCSSGRWPPAARTGGCPSTSPTRSRCSRRPGSTW